VNDPTWELCEEVVRQALARDGATDPGEALCALLWLLRDRHRAGLVSAAARACRGDFELPDPRAGTVVEALRDRAADVRAPGPGMQVVAEVLGELIPRWDFEAMEEAVAAVRRTRELAADGLLDGA
jgi:hypothetical protein